MDVTGQEMILSATGYTGEKGFEVYIDLSMADPLAVWDTLMETGEGLGLEAAGLGARDTLRLEMGYVLYGNEISKETIPVEAKMGWLILLWFGVSLWRRGKGWAWRLPDLGPERRSGWKWGMSFTGTI